MAGAAAGTDDEVASEKVIGTTLVSTSSAPSSWPARVPDARAPNTMSMHCPARRGSARGQGGPERRCGRPRAGRAWRLVRFSPEKQRLVLTPVPRPPRFVPRNAAALSENWRVFMHLAQCRCAPRRAAGGGQRKTRRAAWTLISSIPLSLSLSLPPVALPSPLPRLTSPRSLACAISFFACFPLCLLRVSLPFEGSASQSGLCPARLDPGGRISRSDWDIMRQPLSSGSGATSDPLATTLAPRRLQCFGCLRRRARRGIKEEKARTGPTRSPHLILIVASFLLPQRFQSAPRDIPTAYALWRPSL